MTKSVKTNETTTGNAALVRVKAMFEACSKQPVNFVSCGEFTTTADGTLVPVEKSELLIAEIGDQDTDEGDDDGFDRYEAQMRPVLKPHMLAVINALEAAKISCQDVLTETTAGLSAEQIDEQGLADFVWMAEHDIGWLKTLIQEFNHAADGGMMGLEACRGSALAENKRR